MSFFNEHDRGCTPLMPCRICQAVSFLKERLKPAGFKEFLGILEVPLSQEELPPLEPTVDLDASVEQVLKGRISNRAYHCLLNGPNINTVRQLVLSTKRELQRIPNFGDVSYKEVSEAVAKLGLRLHLSEQDLERISPASQA